MPSEKEIELLHKKYAPTEELFNLVYTHCCIVREIVDELIIKSSLSVDADLALAGALLHDIGVYKLYKDGALDEDNYIQHGILGYELLKTEGLPEKLCRIASHHTGTGITVADIERLKLPLPIADYLAETDEELLVMYADKFHSKTESPRFNSIEKSKRKLQEIGPDKIQIFEDMIEKFGVPDLAPLSQKYGGEIT